MENRKYHVWISVLMFFVLLVLLCPFISFSAIVYVPSLDAPTIQAGINAAVDGDTVVVADGTYTGDGNKNIDFGGKAITLRSENGPDFTIIDCENAGRGFSFTRGEDYLSIVDGFTITKGLTSYGGGIWFSNNSSPSIRNCIIKNNVVHIRGGGIYAHNSSPSIRDCTIEDNQANDFGGGIWSYNSSPSVSGCSIIGNYAVNGGGGIAFQNSSGWLLTTTVEQNSTNKNGGGLWYDNSTGYVTNSLIRQNSAFIDGGGLYLSNNSSPSLEETSIYGNKAEGSTFTHGGGIYCVYSSPAITGCDIYNNSTGYYGGGVYLSSSSPTFINCNIGNNSSVNYAGGIACSYTSSPDFKNCTISGNSAIASGGIRGAYNSSLSITNSIIWGNSAISGGAQIGLYSSSALTIGFSDVEGGYAGIFFEPDCSLSWGSGNINADPLLILFDRKYRLSPDSPCIDAGTDAGVDTDMEDDRRPYNVWNVDNNGSEPEFDMGADEFIECYGDYTVPDDFYYIDQAIEAARNGDRICVRNGTHRVRFSTGLDFEGKAIRLFSENGRSKTTIDCGDKKGLVFQNGESSTTEVIGFTITNGFSDYGGAIRCSNNSSPLIYGCNIIKNRATIRGGGIYSYNSSPTIQYCFIRKNFAGDHGGGIWSFNSSLTIKSSNISDNSAVNNGGGIASQNSSITIDSPNNYIMGNSAGFDGGGLWFSNSSGTISAIYRIEMNSAGHNGGGAHFTDGSSPIITDCNFWNNHASGYGGGISFTLGASPEVSLCDISGNHADGNGGGVYIRSSPSPTIFNCNINGNLALLTGGGIYSLDNASPYFANCTITDNRADNATNTMTKGGGIACNNSSATIINSILWNNYSLEGPEIALWNFSLLTVNYSDVKGGLTEADVELRSILQWGFGNINTDPLFVRVGYWDDDLSLRFYKGDYHLTESSPCIDSGTNVGVDTDIDNDIRPQLTGFDIGSDEFLPPDCRGNFDNDYDIDEIDLATFTAHFGRDNCDYSDPCKGDYNYDRNVDGQDLQLFASEFGRTDCPIQ